MPDHDALLAAVPYVVVELGSYDPKAIMAAPGLGIVFTNKASAAALEAAGGRPRGYYLDAPREQPTSGPS